MSNSEKRPGWIAPVIVLVLIGVAAWYLLKPAPPAPAPVVATPAPQQPAPVVRTDEPGDVLTTVPTQDSIADAAADAGTDVGAETEVAPAVSLPALDASDAVVRKAVFGLKWKPGLASLFIDEEMIRRFVVQVDNIAQGRLIAEQSLFKGLNQDFVARSKGQGYQLDAKNYPRYQPYLDLLESVPAEQVAALYRQFYPLMQQAYQELGYGDAQFDARLQQAIKVLLAAPEISDEPDLTLPSVHYAFADPEVEQLGLAQKQMVRLGLKNQQRLKLLLVRYQPLLAQP